MGGKHGAEKCDLIGLYVLLRLKNKLPNLTSGVRLENRKILRTPGL